MFKIGEFSTLCKTTIKTLRYYDEIGLLKPAAIDETTGYRYYETKQLFILHKIQSLRQSDVSIEDIRQILYGQNIEEILEKHCVRLQKEIDTKAEQLSRLEFILTGKEEESFMNYAVTLKELLLFTARKRKRMKRLIEIFFIRFHFFNSYRIAF